MTAELDYGAVIDRILSRNRWGSERELAKQLGIAPNTWTAYKRGLRSFGVNEVEHICALLDVDPLWLLFGISGPDSRTQQLAGSDAARGTAIDPLLMEKLYKAVERVYRDAGQRPPGHRIANEATELLNMLLEKVADIRDETIVDAVIPALAQKLFERLATAAAEPGTGKRSAS